MAKHNSLWFASCSRLYRKRGLSGGGSEGREEEGEREEEEEYSFILTLFPVLQYIIGSQRRACGNETKNSFAVGISMGSA